MTHLVAALPALIGAPLQFVPSLRRTRPALHRLMDRVYVSGRCCGRPRRVAPGALRPDASTTLLSQMNPTLRTAEDIDQEFAFRVKRDTLGGYVAQVWGWDEEFQQRFHARDWAEHRVARPLANPPAVSQDQSSPFVV